MPRTELFDSYKRWADENGYKPMAAATFYERAAEAGEDVFGYPLALKTRKGVRGFAGVAWRTAADEAADEPDEQSSTGHSSPPEVAGVAGVAASPIFARAYVGEKVDQPATSATPATSHAGAAGAAQVLAPLCAVCRTPMHPALAAAGETTHPNCDPATGHTAAA